MLKNAGDRGSRANRIEFAEPLIGGEGGRRERPGPADIETGIEGLADGGDR